MITTLIAIAVTVAGTSGGIWAFVKKVLPLLRRVVHFLDDWLGSPERSGKEAQPGIMERLQGFDQVLSVHTRHLEVVLHELFPNSGGSLRDEVKRTEADIADIKAVLSQQNRG